MLEGLDAIDWGALGTASDIPGRLRNLSPPDDSVRDDALIPALVATVHLADHLGDLIGLRFGAPPYRPIESLDVRQVTALRAIAEAGRVGGRSWISPPTSAVGIFPTCGKPSGNAWIAAEGHSSRQARPPLLNSRRNPQA